MSPSLNQNASDPKTILLAEDFKDNAVLMKRLLEMEGYRVFIAEDGREAIEKALGIRPDLIILDVSMPVINGLEACELLKGNKKTHDIPIVFISAHDKKSIKDEAFSLGAARYYTKPVDMEEIFRFIVQAIGVSKVKQEAKRGAAAPEHATKLKSKDPFRRCGEVLNGKYELMEFAGSGGMGAVYRALNLLDQSIVAVKILQPHIVARNPEYAGLFEREARHAQSLDHPHIVKVFDSGKDDDLSYMVMEWVEGSSLEDVITRERLSIDRVTVIFEQICSAVASAHQRGIIHLDLKPANILLIEDVKPEDFVKVIDFGLSRVISKESGSTVTKFRGTHQYCAPEQFGGKVSLRSDIYSLGATLYHLLTGVIPFGTSYINAKIHPNLELPEIPSLARQCNLPPELDQVIGKALNKNPDLRQQSAKQLFEEFYDIASSVGVSLPSEAKGEEDAKKLAEGRSSETNSPASQTGEQLTPSEEFDNESARVDELATERPALISEQHSAFPDSVLSNPAPAKYWRHSLFPVIAALVVVLSALIFIPNPLKTLLTSAWAKPPIRLKLATFWRNDLPVLSDQVRAMAKDISAESGGELEIEVLFAGEAFDASGNKIEPHDLFAAVSDNKVQMVHSASYFWEDRVRGASFFSAVPFGMNNEQMESWLSEIGGLQLWRELYKPYNVIPFACGHTGEQMGGWFDKEILTIKDFQGLSIRMPGLGGKVMNKAGARTLSLASQDIVRAKRENMIDAAEWFGAYHDTMLGLHEQWQYYYRPGWQERNTTFELLINQGVFDSLPTHLKKLIERKSNEYSRKITLQFKAKDAEYEVLLRNKGVAFKTFPLSVLVRLRYYTDEVLNDYNNGATQKIYQSYLDYLRRTSPSNRL